MNFRPIISIEDSDEDFAALTHALRAAGVPNSLERCQSGAAAMALLRSPDGCPLADRASLILLDLNLPGSDGLALLSEFRSQDPKRLVPVVVLSTSGHRKEIDECYRAGANAYVVKPFDLDEWESKVGKLANFWLHAAELPTRPRADGGGRRA
ncbi:Two-component system response regulator [Bradyrhizobium sp. ORS 375]|uniref:response regulator n=1 Tax=Bradyrhizobium sp. (strain ORS 375) TaxID=566679 RepID=UPI000240860F|nr:response regulator [Bradyrhizobium sp. ORS 375]CCD95821.1 Two-component system response regulator [Bradyrhizobium sp. ORS 375]